MILYLDTSALLKKSFKEQGSRDVIRLWKNTSAIVTSTVAYAETLAAIYRKKRDPCDIDHSVFKAILIAFEKDWKSFIHVDVTSALNMTIEKVVTTHSLRGFDAIHLASALIEAAGKECFVTYPETPYI